MSACAVCSDTTSTSEIENMFDGHLWNSFVLICSMLKVGESHYRYR